MRTECDIYVDSISLWINIYCNNYNNLQKIHLESIKLIESVFLNDINQEIFYFHLLKIILFYN